MPALRTDETHYADEMTTSQPVGSLTAGPGKHAPLTHIKILLRTSGRLAHRAEHFFEWIEIGPMRHSKERGKLQFKRTVAMLVIAVTVRPAAA